MARWGQPDRCVFCGLPIGPDEPAVGHGESAAHVACADAALGDERLWDGIAVAVGGDGLMPGGDGPVPGGEDPVPADGGPGSLSGRVSRDHPPAPADVGPGSPSGGSSPPADRSGCALVGALLLAAASAAWRVRH